MTEEGRGTLEFFKKYPDMADKILGAINMDMVGENLDENHAFFNIEMPPYSNTSFIQSVPLNFTKYVFETNIERHSSRGQTSSIYYPVPIVEKNGSMQPFRFLVEPYVGGSDHMVFLGSDAGVSALSFNVWPDFWYHTDKDRPDRSDPTQLKRVAFIGTASALAICSGDEGILENLVRTTYEDRLNFIQDAVNHWIGELSRLKENDRGLAFKNAVDSTQAAVDLSKEALLGIKVLTQNKRKIDSYLDSVINNIEGLFPQHEKHLRSYYSAVGKLKDFKPEYAKPSAEEVKLKNMIPAKVQPLKLGDWAPYSEISGALRKKPELLREFYKKYSYQYLMQLFFSMDGKRNLAQIRRILGLEFTPVTVDDFMKHVRALVEAKLIQFLKE